MSAETAIRFILNGAEVRLSDIDPTLTLLQYLRETRRLTGTKEGCAEGDCGACTVVIAEAKQDRIRLRSINACIQFVAMLHGKAIFTVEALKTFGAGKLHPVQQAMVDYHGSQCGFCTPGFVMSLFALFKSTPAPERAHIDAALSGNLCRCTGYRPIIAAAQHMADYASDAHWLTQAGISSQCGAEERRLLDQLAGLDSKKVLHIATSQRQLFAPAREQDLVELCARYPQATLVAGNTDVGLWVNKQLRELPVVVVLSRVAALQHIVVSESAIEIRAGVTLSDAFAALLPYFPQLDSLFQRFASQPVRNAGTLVGNIANGSPIGDMPPLLLALQAEVELVSVTGSRHIALDQFYLGYQQKDLRPGEYLRALHIPLPRDQRIASYKVSKRFDQDISALCAAFALTLDEHNKVQQIRMAYGGMAAIPQLALATQQALQGKLWTQSTIEQALPGLGEDFTPLSDMRASADYRLTVAGNLLRRFLLETQTTPQAPMPTLHQLEASA